MAKQKAGRPEGGVMDFEEAQRQMRISNPRVAEIVTIEGRAAYARADAWARSPKNTAYGSTSLSGKVPDAK